MIKCRNGHNTIIIGRYGKNCKVCHKIQVTKWRVNNRKKVNDITRRYRKTKPDVQKNSRLKADYGITLEDYNTRLKEQVNRCAICGIHKVAFRQWFAVDHNHITKQVRGLLCTRCNTGLGWLENKEWLVSANKYLKKWNKNL